MPTSNIARHAATLCGGLLLAAGCYALTGAAGAQASPGPIVQTANGPVEGFLSNSVAEFLGIPYAAPPVGTLRWKPPQAHSPWTKTLKATAYGGRCAQVTTLGVFAGPATSNEDCLFINVFSPNLQKGANLPVIFWIHGGGNLDGESNDYDGSKMALQGNTVVVTINYRLNVMGFLAVPSLDNEGHNFANYGLMDQQFALKWVRNNIASFGGDPHNVTVGGQSAGAEDTGFAMLSPLAKGLLDRGICESFCPTGNLPTVSAAEAIGTQFAGAAGCGNKTGEAQAICLRNVPAATVEALAGTASAASKFVLGPILDGTVLPTQPPTAWANGQFTHIPLINGNVQDEEDFSLAISEYFSKPRQPPTGTQYMNYIATTYASPPYPAGTAQKILSMYALNAYPSAQVAWDRVGTDPGICGEMRLNSTLASQIPVYAYLFEDQTPPMYFPKMPGFVPLAYHTSDIQYLFPLYHGGQGRPHLLTGDQVTLSDQLVSAWTKFAWTGNPSGQGSSPWPQYSTNANKPTILVENVPILTSESLAQFNATHHCTFWASIAGD